MAFQWTNHMTLILTNSPLTKDLLKPSSIVHSSLPRAMAFQWTNHLALIASSPLTKEVLMLRAIILPP
jgi:hypothetical protein